MYKILKNIIEMDDYSVQKLSKSQAEPFQWNTVEGTELNVSDCIGGKGKIEVKGNTYQKQLSGKNLWGFLDSNWLADTNASHSIIDKNILEVTSTNNTYANSKFRLDLPDGTYTFKLGKVTNSNANMSTKRMTLSKYINNTRTAIQHIDEGNSYTFTISNNEDEYYVLEFWAAYATALVNTARFENIQIEEGSTATDLEPYCGGQPSPNPDYPQEIKVVTGDNVVKHVSKNQFDKATDIILKQTYTANGGTTQLDNSFIQTKYIRVKPNTSYILHTDTDITQIKDNRLVICEYDSNYNFIRRNLATNVNTYTKVMGSNTQYVRICATTESIDTLQLEEGTTTPYEPYRGEEYKLDLWKENEFDSENVEKLNAYFSDNEKIIASSNSAKTVVVSCKSNTTYRISKKQSSRFRVGYSSSKLDYSGILDYAKMYDSEKEVIIQTNNTAKYMYIYYYSSSSDTLTEQEILDSIQIQEAIELCKIGDYSDILFKNVAGDENYNAELENGAWYKKKAIDKKVLDDLWTWFNNATNRFSVEITAPDGDYILVALCNKFINAPNWTAHTNTDKSFIVRNGDWGQNKCRISFLDTDYNSLAEWIQFVSENNLIVYHRLLNPTYEKITDPTLISQLEALRKAKWFKGVNHCWTETDNLEPVLEGTYKQSIQSETQNSIANLQVQANEQNTSNTPESEV